MHNHGTPNPVPNRLHGASYVARVLPEGTMVARMTRRCSLDITKRKAKSDKSSPPSGGSEKVTVGVGLRVNEVYRPARFELK